MPVRRAKGLLQFETEQVRARLAEIDDVLHEARQLLDQARDRKGELSATAAKLQADAQYMGETCLNELGVEREQLLADSTLAIVSGEAACRRRPGPSRDARQARGHGPGEHDGARRV